MIKEALKDTQGALYGYVPLGIAFGLLFQSLHFTWWYAVLMSLLVYGGSAQFIAIPMIAAHSSVFEIGLTAFMVNLRHIFYGVSFIDKFQFPFWIKKYLIFGLTDESYAIILAKAKYVDRMYELWVVILCHFYWVLGAVIGVCFYKQLANVDVSFLYFSLPALFVVLTIEAYKHLKKFLPMLCGIVAIIMCKLVNLSDYLFTSILISAILLFIILNFKKDQ